MDEKPAILFVTDSNDWVQPYLGPTFIIQT
jgi:hypothetical protein